MPRTAIRLCLLAALAVGPAGAAARCVTDIAVFEPGRVRIPASLDRAAATRAVMRAFVIRGWRVTRVDRAAGHVDAELPVRQHVARVRARIGSGAVSFAYRRSDNLPHGWEAGEQPLRSGSCTPMVEERPGPDAPELVHPNYAIWVDDVARTLEGTLRLAALPAPG